MNKKIKTVFGEIPAAELGRTLLHEHIICTSPVFFRLYGEKWFSREQVIAESVKKLKAAKEKNGLNTLVDGTPLNLGRDLDLLKEVSRQSGVHIIASTGMYFYPDFAFLSSPEEKLADLMTGECLDGNTGFLKCAADREGMTPYVQKLHRVMGRVQQATGVPVFVHTCRDTGAEQLKILLDSGADPAKIVMGHCADGMHPEYALELLRHGCYVSIDRIFRENPDWRKVKTDTLYELLCRGYEKQIVLSHDYICYADECYVANIASPHADPDGLCVIDDLVVPEMLQRGISPQTIRQILLENPADILGR